MKSSGSFAEKTYDIAIIGAGVLGISTAYWLSSLYDCSISLIDKEETVSFHTSSRNTGVVHRPFYLNPEKKKIFALSAQRSYYLWRELASKFHLPWSQVGTLEVAKDELALQTLEQYLVWAVKNGMQESEVELLDRAGVEKVEPEVKCLGAIFSRTDTSVDYGKFSRTLFELANKNGVDFIGGYAVKDLKLETDGITLELFRKAEPVQSFSCNFLINLAGGGSVDIAHKFGLAREYTDLHFRGEYWVVDENFGLRIKHHVYSVPKYREFPFLDPHFIVRASGKREIGPNAVLVFGPNAYKGLAERKTQILSKIFERPVVPKIKLFTNGTFLSLVWHESRSSLSKEVMCERVRQFIPGLDSSFLLKRGVAGVRNSLIDNNGFVSEAVEIYGDRSLHVLNYNSPGATGAPAYSAHLIKTLQTKGYLGKMRTKIQGANSDFWKFDDLPNLSIA